MHILDFPVLTTNTFRWVGVPCFALFTLTLTLTLHAWTAVIRTGLEESPRR